MKGLELSRRYFHTYGLPMLEEAASRCAHPIAAGLVGYGSECFGYDDALSADHDYGPAFCLWLTPEDYQAVGDALQAAYDALPQEFLGFSKRVVSPRAGRRVGVFAIPDFYRTFVGPYQPPADPIQWLRLSEAGLAAATNGAVFQDPLGQFTAVREGLLGYYPREVWLNKIAGCLSVMAQSGQYNYRRCLLRGELVAARLALGEFLRSAIGLAHLLARQYMPFYKWAFRHMTGLPLPPRLSELVSKLAAQTVPNFLPQSREETTSPYLVDGNTALIEELCALFVSLLREMGLSDHPSDFLLEHATRVASQIENDDLRRLALMEG